MAVLVDEEFGEIMVRKTRTARHIRISVAPDGRLRASIPFFASMRSLKNLLNTSRSEVRAMLHEHRPTVVYGDGSRIGKSHSLLVASGLTLKVRREQLKIVVTLPANMLIENLTVQEKIRVQVRTALRVEAKHYLPRRLERLADQLNCRYEKVRFSHASTRWGSCSSTGTISLNIALMQLPFELIDYVLIHELCHTKQMNHSPAFWNLVEEADPEYVQHRHILKKYSPTI